jgi:hypothetical protein
VWLIGFTPGQILKRRQIDSVLRNKRRTFAYTWGVVSWLVTIGLRYLVLLYIHIGCYCNVHGSCFFTLLLPTPVDG